MQSCIKYFAVASLIFAASTATSQIATTFQIGKPDTPTLGLPYTADQTIHIVQHLGNGLVVTHDVTGRLARNADGVERYEGNFPSTDPAHPDSTTMACIIDRYHRTSITLNTTRKTATRQSLPAVATVTVQVLPLQGSGPRIKPENVTIADLGKKTMGMLPITGRLVSASIPIGQLGNEQPLPITTEVWIAPELKLVVRQIEKNPQFGERTLELTNIRGEEPDPALFQIPEGYTITDRAPLQTAPGQIGTTLVTPAVAPTPIPEQRTKQIEDALNSRDPIVKNMAEAAEDTRNAGVASGYLTQLAGTGDEGATRLAASRAAMTTETAAAAAETAAAAVEADSAKAIGAAAAGDRAAADNARDKAASDYSALLAADNQLAKAATELAAAAMGNAAFLAANPASAAINDLGAQDSSAAANLLSTAEKGAIAAYSAAAANQATAIKDANIIAGLDLSRAVAFKAVANAEAQAQSAATAEAAGDRASAAAAEAAAATAAATADGPGNPYAGAVEMGAAAVANAEAATISAQHAMDGLRTLR